MATTQPRTPGVTIYEPDSFPPSIVGVGTAVPAFIGYTETGYPIPADAKPPTIPVPQKINSMVEFEAQFGGAFTEQFYLDTAPPVAPLNAVGTVTIAGVLYYVIEDPQAQYNLYNALRMFFANGGSECYIVSCGPFTKSDGSPRPPSKDDFLAGLAGVKDLVGPTILVIPDAVLLDPGTPPATAAVGGPVVWHPTYNDTINAMLGQCLDKQDRVAIIDVWAPAPVAGRPDTDPTQPTIVDQFRTGLAAAPRESRRYGMAYYPYLMTSLVQPTDVSVANLATKGSPPLKPADGVLAKTMKAIKASADAAYPPDDPQRKNLERFLTYLGTQDWVPDNVTPGQALDKSTQMTASQLTQTLTSSLPDLVTIFGVIATSQNLVPPSGAIAGLYARNDQNAGVWNAPANMGVATAIGPVFNISGDQQADMNVPINGMAVNAIRTFVGRGTLVWGARTLDGTSSDWRYIQVRRTMIFIEQSVKQALDLMVFAPNTAQTWVTVVSMVESFLHGLWAAGGLGGSSPGAAYTVTCGLGSTMTPDDILAGNMIVHIVLTMVHPAEFIQLVFKQQMLGGS